MNSFSKSSRKSIYKLLALASKSFVKNCHASGANNKFFLMYVVSYFFTDNFLASEIRRRRVLRKGNFSYAGGSTDSSNHHRQRSGAGGHLGAVERNGGGGGKSRIMNRLKNGSGNIDLGFDDEDVNDDDEDNEYGEGGFEPRKFRGMHTSKNQGLQVQCEPHEWQ